MTYARIASELIAAVAALYAALRRLVAAEAATPAPTVEEILNGDAAANAEVTAADAAVRAATDEIDFLRKMWAGKQKQENTCSRCNGAGHFNCYRHVANGVCFRCGGNGRDPMAQPRKCPVRPVRELLPMLEDAARKGYVTLDGLTFEETEGVLQSAGDAQLV